MGTLPVEPNPSIPVESTEQISHKHYLISRTISVITSMFFSPISYSCSLTAGYTSNSSDLEMVVTIPHLPAPCQLHLPFLSASYHFISPSWPHANQEHHLQRIRSTLSLPSSICKLNISFHPTILTLISMVFTPGNLLNVLTPIKLISQANAFSVASEITVPTWIKRKRLWRFLQWWTRPSLFRWVRENEQPPASISL